MYSLQEESPFFGQFEPDESYLFDVETCLANNTEAVGYICKDGDNVVGVIIAGITSIAFHKTRIAMDVVFYVHPDYRKFNVGNNLLDFYHMWAESQQAKATFIQNTSGINSKVVNRYYEMNGYKNIGNIFMRNL